MTTINGVSSVGDTLATGLRIACSPAGGRIVDIGFLDTELLLVLWQERHDDGSDGPTLLLRIPYTASVASSSSKLTPVFTLPYQTYHPPSTYTSAAASAAIQIHDLSLSALTQALPSLPPLTVSPPPPLTSTSADDDHAKTEPTKTASTSFLPTRMEVLPASHARGHLPARVCLLGADGVSYVVFALPEPGAEPGEVAGPGSVGREAALPAEVADDEDTTMLSV